MRALPLLALVATLATNALRAAAACAAGYGGEAAAAQDAARGEELFARAEGLRRQAGAVTPEARALYHEALRELLRAEAPGDAASRKIGVALFRVGDHKRSLAFWREVLAQDPRDAQAVELEITVLAASGAVDGAVAAYGRSVREAPVAARRALLSFPAGADKSAHWPAGDPAPRVLEAHDLVRRGSWPQASSALLDLARDPATMAAVEELLVLASGRAIDDARYDDGLAGFRRICDSRPGDAFARANLALALRFAGRAEESKASYLEAIALAPADGGIRNDLGLLLQGTGDSEGAERRFREAMSVDPQGAGAFNGATNLLWLRRADPKIRVELLPILARVASDPTRLRGRILFLRTVTAGDRGSIL